MHKYPVSWLVGAWAMVALLLLLSGPALAVPLTINNPSFEEGLNGWDSSQVYWLEGVKSSADLLGYPDYTSPDGNNVAYVTLGGDLYQTPGATIAANTTYTLTVYVGHPGLRNPPAPMPGDPPPPLFSYSVQLWASQPFPGLLATESGYDPGQSYFGMLTLSYTSGQSGQDGHIGSYLKILLKAGPDSGMVNFDKLTLDAVPVPPTVWLLGSGLLGLVGWRRFRKN